MEEGWTVARTRGARSESRNSPRWRLTRNELPSRADEGAPLPVLAIARLLADQHHLGGGGALAEHGLGGVAVQVAGRAPGRGRPEVAELGPLGDQVAGRARRPLAGWHGGVLG